MTKSGRITLFIINFFLLMVIFFVTTGRFFPSSEQSVVLFSSLLMLSFVTLFLEHFFTSPTDVMASTIAILLLLSPLHPQLSKLGRWYWIFFGYNLLLLLTSLVALLLLDDNKSSAAMQNRVSSTLKRFSVFFGNGRFLFFVLFFLTLLFYVDSQSGRFLVIAGYASVILLIDPKGFVLSSWRSRRKAGLDIGEIIGVQSRNTFLAKLYTERVPVRRFDIVAFRYSMDEGHRVFKGMIVDNFLLNEQQWIKILATDDILKALGSEPHTEIGATNVVSKIQGCIVPEFLGRFVGLVIERSSIMKLRFDYAGRLGISEGNLLEAHVSGKKVLYQVTQGLTEIEALEQKNEAGLVVGESVQLGIWDPDRLLFEKYGWVPEINTPLFMASHAPEYVAQQGEKQVGSIPGTNYPVLMNLRQAVTHHTAILGITGSGKSVFCRDLIRNIIVNGTKVICVDFTNEYRNKFPNLAPANVVTDAHKKELFEAINLLSTELEKFGSQQNKKLIADMTQILKERFYEAVKVFMQSDKTLALFELPDVSNTTGILEYTKWFFHGLFQVARQDANFGKQVCVVLEEAHTVIPEWNFIGVEEKKAQSLVNSISQIALQGRKYNVGFIVVAQRTANVSKTVLTQCNTIVAFQQFDRTSSDFLLNYMGAEMVAALPALRFRQAIAVGKAFRSGVPLIFEVPVIKEE
ncbi:MAG: DUF87 domain-containing protein [candidate division Zixibacteria bacterium]|nr:DUF87 domain-containing protein [candidate division Zixibacteria bacterium]